MKVNLLQAELEGEVEVVAVDRWRAAVTLSLEGQRVTLRAGDTAMLTLKASRGGPVVSYEGSYDEGGAS